MHLLVSELYRVPFLYRILEHGSRRWVSRLSRPTKFPFLGIRRAEPSVLPQHTGPPGISPGNARASSPLAAKHQIRFWCQSKLKLLLTKLARSFAVTGFCEEMGGWEIYDLETKII